MINLKTFIFLFIVWNTIVFLIYGIDKRNAIKNKKRISEKTLLILSFLLGSVGSAIAMNSFRHKTKHLKFNILVPISLIVNIFIIYLLIKYQLITK